MPLSDAALDRLFGEAHIAVLATLNPDGSPHQAPVWFQWRDGAMLVPTERTSRKWRNISRDPRVSICIDRREPPVDAAIVHGTADELAVDYLEERRRFYERYVGVEGAEAAMAANPVDPSAWVVVRITPARIVSFGASG